MDTLTKKAILDSDDLDRRKVDVPEWGGTVWVRTLTGSERDQFEGSIIDTRGTDTKLNYTNLRAKLCVLTITDEEGQRLFTDGDVGALGNKSAAALDRIFDVAQRLNGLRPQDIDELVKNSGSGPGEDSVSG